MWISILKPAIYGKYYYEKRKRQPTENQKNTKSLFLHLVFQKAVHPPSPVTYSPFPRHFPVTYSTVPPFPRHLLHCSQSILSKNIHYHKFRPENGIRT